MRFVSYGGGVDPRALIGEPPEGREWSPGQPEHKPSIDPTARVEAFATVDSGLDRPTVVGPRTWLMKHVHVGHDTIIGADCELAPGVVIGGSCTVGDGTHVGINACVRPLTHVGKGCKIGAGAVVTRNVPDGEVWAGNPARKLEPAEYTRDLRPGVKLSYGRTL